jgi:hypothetical protein
MALEDMIGDPDDDEGDGLPVSDVGGAKAKKRRAVRRMFQAAKAGDWDGAMEAYADAYEACVEHESEEDDEDLGGGGYDEDDEDDDEGA